MPKVTRSPQASESFALRKLDFDERGRHPSPGALRHPLPRGERGEGKNYSPNVNNDAFPPAAVVFTVSVRSVTNRSR